jgi:hypothetical protein
LQTAPLQQQITQLTKENNQLHLDLIRAADLRDEKDNTAQHAFRRYETQLAELKFMNGHLVAKVEEERTKATSERSRLEHVMTLLGMTVGKEIDGALLPGCGFIADAEIHVRNVAKVSAASKLNRHLQRIDIETGLGAADMRRYRC